MILYMSNNYTDIEKGLIIWKALYDLIEVFKEIELNNK